MDEDHRMTKRLLRFVQAESLRITFAEVARQCGLDEKTVRDIFKAHTAQLEKTHTFATPAVLGIDELHLLNKPRCVLTNVEYRTVIDLLEKRDQKTVQAYLSKIEDGHKIEIVTMDMWRPYRQAVAAALPNAVVVVDKFHIVRMANQALDKVRKDLRESLSDKKRRTLKKDRFILLHRKRDLDDQDLFILDTWTKNFPELGQAYELKEEFFLRRAEDPGRRRASHDDARHADHGTSGAYRRPLGTDDRPGARTVSDRPRRLPRPNRGDQR
jgi:transposase